jgi:hypothetical protein
MQKIKEQFPDAKVFELTELVEAEEVGQGPWRIYVYGRDGFHSGGAWFRAGKRLFPDEEITFANAKDRAEKAIAARCEVRICDGMDHLVFHSVLGDIFMGSTFWNEANPHPDAVKLTKKLSGKR